MNSYFDAKKEADPMEESAIGCYNEIVKNQNYIQRYHTPIRLKMPVDMERIIKISDAVYSFNEVMEHIDLNKYFVEKGHKTGCPKSLKLVLFAFMERGYSSVREIEKLCETDIRFMWILDEEKAPSFRAGTGILWFLPV